MLRGAVKKGLPYRGKLRWGKVTKFLLGKEKYYDIIKFSREK